LGLILGKFFVPEGRHWPIKTNNQMGRLEVSDDLQEHAGKSENGVNQFAFSGSQWRNSVIGPVQESVAVNQNQPSHAPILPQPLKYDKNPDIHHPTVN
jgi:hypothetical protein